MSSYVSEYQRETPDFDLFGVVNHRGTVDRGHYYSFAKNNHTDRKYDWFYQDDLDVRGIAKMHLLCNKDAYILFYSKMS